MRKSYSHFTTDDLDELGLTLVQADIFSVIAPKTPSAWLEDSLFFNQKMPLLSEKARSELLITPVLLEMRRQNPHSFTFFSGCSLNVDPQRGLKGVCDFILATPWNAVFLQSPIMAIVEAKHNQDLADAIPQCSAEMLAADLFNQRKNTVLHNIYGVVTNGHEWLFLKLHQQIIQMDSHRYTIHQLSELLGVWQYIINEFSSQESQK